MARDVNSYQVITVELLSRLGGKVSKVLMSNPEYKVLGPIGFLGKKFFVEVGLPDTKVTNTITGVSNDDVK